MKRTLKFLVVMIALLAFSTLSQGTLAGACGDGSGVVTGPLPCYK